MFYFQHNFNTFLHFCWMSWTISAIRTIPSWLTSSVSRRKSHWDEVRPSPLVSSVSRCLVSTNVKSMVLNFQKYWLQHKVFLELLWLELKTFPEGFLRKNEIINFDFQNKKYLTPENFLEDLRRFKIKFWTTFVFCTKFIFQLPFELLSFEKVTFWG